MNSDWIQLKEAKERIVGMWYDANTKTEYFFRYPNEQEGYAELLLLQDYADSPVPFRYRVIYENQQLFLELDGTKYSIVQLIDTPAPILSFTGSDGNTIVLYKGSLHQKKKIFLHEIKAFLLR